MTKPGTVVNCTGFFVPGLTLRSFFYWFSATASYILFWLRRRAIS